MGVRVSLHAAKDGHILLTMEIFDICSRFHHLKLPLPYATVLPTPGSTFSLTGGPAVLTEFSSMSWVFLLRKKIAALMFRGLSQQSTTSWADSNHKTLLFTVMQTGSPGARCWHLPKQGLGVGSVVWLTLCFQLLTVSGIPTPVGRLPCHCPV